MIRYIILILSLNLICFVFTFEPNTYGYGGANTEMVEDGKIQFQLLQERGNLPQYGSCWKQSISHVEDGCRNLSEETQSDIALHLTNCFLEMSGHSTYECITDKKPNLRRICISSMTDRAFNVYTEFYTHTQNICWFLRGQMWHETINENTKDVGRQLTESNAKQKQLLSNQDESLKLQQKMLHYSFEMEKILGDFYVSSRKHQDLLGKVSETLVNLQNWLLGEISWFDTILFYMSVSFFILFFTATQRTSNSRFPLIILLSLVIIFERFLCYKSTITNIDDDININHRMYYNYIWILRYIFIVASFIILVTYAAFYKDYLHENNVLMQKLHEKIGYLTKYIENSGETTKMRRSIVNIETETERNIPNDSFILKSPHVLLNTFESVNKSGNDSYASDLSVSSRSVTPLLRPETIGNGRIATNRQNSNESDLLSGRYNLRSRLATPTPDKC